MTLASTVVTTRPVSKSTTQNVPCDTETKLRPSDLTAHPIDIQELSSRGVRIGSVSRSQMRSSLPDTETMCCPSGVIAQAMVAQVWPPLEVIPPMNSTLHILTEASDCCDAVAAVSARMVTGLLP